MKKLIMASILSISFLASAQTCPEGDKNCLSTASGGAGTIALGIDCEGCRDLENKRKAMLSNTEGIFRGGSQGTSSGTGSGVTDTIDDAGVKN